MSNRAITWAYRQELKAGPKFVLVTLADMADQEHSCYPGVGTLAELTGYGRTAVRTHIEALIDAGLVTTQRRHKGNGARTSDRYYLAVEGHVGAESGPTPEAPRAGIRALAAVDVEPESGPTEQAPRAGIRADVEPDSERLEPDSAVALKEEPTDEPQGEPSDVFASAREGLLELEVPEPPTLSIEEFFDLFWDAYPRHTARKPAFDKFVIAARKLDPGSLVMAAQIYRDHPGRPLDLTKVPHAATWLHQERWDDEIPIPLTARPTGHDTPPTRPPTNAQRALVLVNQIPEGDPHGPATDRPALGARLGS